MATKFHIARRLLNLGWQENTSINNSLFNDENLQLNDEVSIHLEYKHLLAKLVEKHCKEIMPLTYSINDDNYQEIIAKIIYQNYMVNNRFEKNIADLKWILKPSMLNNGDNIYLFNNIEELKSHYASGNRLGGFHVVQRYIPNPALMGGRKFTFRVSAVVTNYAGIFLYKQGYINISAELFNLHDGFHNKKVHITNYVLDNEFANIEQRSTKDVPHFDEIYKQMTAIVLKVFSALISENPDYLKPSKVKKFEIFGFDFMLDDKGKLWLLEINQAPDAPTFEENKLDPILWEPFWKDIIEEFVVPIAMHSKPLHGYEHYEQILTAKACFSKTKSLMHRLFK